MHKAFVGTLRTALFASCDSLRLGARSGLDHYDDAGFDGFGQLGPCLDDGPQFAVRVNHDEPPRYRSLDTSPYGNSGKIIC